MKGIELHLFLYFRYNIEYYTETGDFIMRKRAYQTITPVLIKHYIEYLQEQEKSEATIAKYSHDLSSLYSWLEDTPLTKTALIGWKEYLAKKYAPSSVNTMLAALNSLLDYCGWQELKVKPLKIQKCLFCSEDRELTRSEYIRLIRAAEKAGNKRLSLVIQTICSTGIRVSELNFITVEAIRTGRAEIYNKGKRRTAFLPKKLRLLLKKYTQIQKIKAGAVFVTQTGRPLDRSNIWRDMKALCESADVMPEKVFPHNLRHLFARTYYILEKDLSRLADILGHSNINTTRIYTVESGAVHEKQIACMELVIT